jgi:transposase-like protein
MRRNLDRWTFRCSKKNCRREFSMRKHTFFFESQLGCHEIMNLGLLWLNRVSVKSATGLTGHSPRIVCDFFGHFRHLVAATLTEEDQLIGGPDIHVQIDESKFGKRKYNVGHRVEGAWIVGGVEETEERRVFLVEVENRSADTLLSLIKRFVRPGSIITTDMWGGYFPLSTIDGYEKHLVVNHSKNFKDSESGAHTNHIEGTWNGIKINLRARNRTKGNIEDFLFEFIWRRKNKADLWGAFVDAIRSIHYDLE